MEENTKQQEAPKQESQEKPKEAEQPVQQPDDKDKDIQENKLWALLSYLGILCIIPLLGKKESKFAQFHAKQGLVLLIGWVVSWFPIFGWAIGIIAFVLSIMGIINALSGEMKKLPIVGDLAEKINI